MEHSQVLYLSNSFCFQTRHLAKLDKMCTEVHDDIKIPSGESIVPVLTGPNLLGNLGYWHDKLNH